MKYLLDTNVVIALMKGHPGLTGRLKRERPEDLAVSAIVMHELFYGAWRSTRQSENFSRLEMLPFTILDFDREDAEAAGKVRAFLASQGGPIGPYDALIAGQAISRRLTLISRNIREFGRVPLLLCENWEDG